jgi:hypothetical protein
VLWLPVDRFCDQKLLPHCNAAAQKEASPNVEVPRLNLDLVFTEDWEDYVKTKVMPPSKRRFICQVEGGTSFVEETLF